MQTLPFYLFLFEEGFVVSVLQGRQLSPSSLASHTVEPIGNHFNLQYCTFLYCISRQVET